MPIPFNIPPDRQTEILITAGGDPPVAPHSERLAFVTEDPYTVQAERFAAMALDGAESPFPAADAVANLSVMERIFADAG